MEMLHSEESPSQVHRLALEAVRRDPSVWPRSAFDEEALARYRDCLDQLPPVRIDRTTRLLLDGFHRVRVYEEAGRSEIPVIEEDCPPGMYLLRALELNRHGRPISLPERNRVIVQLAEQGIPQRVIAQAAGLSPERVSQILAAYKLDKFDARLEPEDFVWEAVRLVEQGRSIREAASVTGIP